MKEQTAEKDNHQVNAKRKYEDKRHRINVRYLKDTEYIQLKSAAENCGFSENELSEYIKEVSLNGAIIKETVNLKDFKESKDLLFQVRKIGLNFNQLAKQVNTFQDKTFVKTILNQVDIVKQMINKIETHFIK